MLMNMRISCLIGLTGLKDILPDICLTICEDILCNILVTIFEDILCDICITIFEDIFCYICSTISENILCDICVTICEDMLCDICATICHLPSCLHSQVMRDQGGGAAASHKTVKQILLLEIIDNCSGGLLTAHI